MEINLDANATTAVLPQARQAALAAMAADFGNPSSTHIAGLKARAILDEARAAARRVLGVGSGRIVFTSGATEGIQTAVLSALVHARAALRPGAVARPQLLYGATEHKAVPQALQHWCTVLGLDWPIRAIPVGSDGRHDLAWLKAQAPTAALVCTMAANNETGVISDLDGIAAVLQGSAALWLVDGVQALGKLPLRLAERRIDYAPFSGHKLHAPKGTGLLYVREGAPFTPLQAGGGQESALRAGTENMPGIAALGAVLRALEQGDAFCNAATLADYRARLSAALGDALPGLVFNAPPAACLPTTLNFSVPGVPSRQLLDVFDAAGLRMSGGSACSAGTPEPSPVLCAMGVPAAQAASAVRLSFGAAESAAAIDEACARIRTCGQALRAHGALPALAPGRAAPPLLNRFVVEGACCWLVADAASRQCLVIDPLLELTEELLRWVQCRDLQVVAVLDTHSHGDHASSAQLLREALGLQQPGGAAVTELGWPVGRHRITLGAMDLTRLAVPGHTLDATAYLLRDAEGGLRCAFVGDTVLPGALGRSDFAQSDAMAYAASLRMLDQAVGRHTLLLPGHDYDDQQACTLAGELRVQPLLRGVLDGTLSDEAFATRKAEIERDLAPTPYQTLACGARVDGCPPSEPVGLPADRLLALMGAAPAPVLVDVREATEQQMGGLRLPGAGASAEQVPLPELLNALPRWLRLPAGTPVVFYCRSGNRSAQAARALRRLGHANAWSLAGGLALWPRAVAPVGVGAEALPA